MSLRRDVHMAFDEMTPPLGGMPERVVQTLLADKRRQRNREMSFGLRAPLSLVAVLVVVALVAVALIGGRLAQDWSSLHRSAPAGERSVTLAELEARPIVLPTVPAGEPCPQSPGPASRNYQFGGGPVYADGGLPMPTDWGTYFDVIYYTAPDLKGLVLIRGQDLRNPQVRVVFVGQHATGAVVGNDPDPIGGAQRGAAVLDAGSPPSRVHNRDGMWPLRQGVSRVASGCYGFQIDGSGFTETFTGGK